MSRQSFYWLLVDNTEFELPLYVAETITELANYLGVKEELIRCRESYARRNNINKVRDKRGKIIKVLKENI